jgi:transcription initiation factor IIE alpha subunit
MASCEDIRLATALTKQQFGLQTSQIVELLAKHGVLTFSQLCSKLSIRSNSKRKLKIILATLIQHQFITFDCELKSPEQTNDDDDNLDYSSFNQKSLVQKTPVKYRVHLKRIFLVLKYSNILANAAWMSPLAREIMKHVLSNGKIQASHVISKIMVDKKACAKLGVPATFSTIHNGFKFLAEHRYLTSRVLDKDTANPYKPEIKPDAQCNDLAQTLYKLKKLRESHLFSEKKGGEISDAKTGETSEATGINGMKRNKVNIKAEQLSEDDEEVVEISEVSGSGGGMQNKVCKLDSDANLVLPDDGVYWSCNFKQWDLLFTRNLISKTVSSRFDERAAGIAELFLDASNQFGSSRDCEKTTIWRPLSEIKKDETFKNKIQTWFPEGQCDVILAKQMLHDYIKVMSNDKINPGKHVPKLKKSWIIADYEANVGDPQWSLNIYNVLRLLVVEQVVTLARQSYGPDAVRVIRILSEKNYSDKTTLAKLTMFDEKYLQLVLYKLLSKRLISTQPLPKRPGSHCDYTYQTSHFIFGLELEQTSRFLLENCKLTWSSLEARRQVENVNSAELMRRFALIQNFNKNAENEEEKQSLSLEEKRGIDKLKKKRGQIRKHKLLLAKDMHVLDEFLKRATQRKEEDIDGFN